jgi:hypothetical protein
MQDPETHERVPVVVIQVDHAGTQFAYSPAARRQLMAAFGIPGIRMVWLDPLYGYPGLLNGRTDKAKNGEEQK